MRMKLTYRVYQLDLEPTMMNVRACTRLKFRYSRIVAAACQGIVELKSRRLRLIMENMVVLHQTERGCGLRCDPRSRKESISEQLDVPWLRRFAAAEVQPNLVYA